MYGMSMLPFTGGLRLIYLAVGLALLIAGLCVGLFRGRG